MRPFLRARAQAMYSWMAFGVWAVVAIGVDRRISIILTGTPNIFAANAMLKKALPYPQNTDMNVYATRKFDSLRDRVA